MELKRKKVKYGSYMLVDKKTGEEVARVDKTGTHLDDYPWDWYLVNGKTFGDAKMKSGLPVKTGGVAASLKDIVDTVQSSCNQYGLHHG